VAWGGDVGGGLVGAMYVYLRGLEVV
jgi:hypothetical protein